jgi:malate permease and related proteins
MINDTFLSTFSVIFQALIKIFLIAGLAGFLTWRKIISEEVINGLSLLVVYIFLPLLTFSIIITSFNPNEQGYWWWVPLLAIAMPVAGLLVSGLLFAGKIKEKRGLLPLASMQNAAYLILPIGEFAFKDQFEEFSLICFLVILGLNPFMWSVGKIIITKSKISDLKAGQMFTPPFIANVLALGLVLSGAHKYVPAVVTESAHFLGSATVPIATFILGATLALSMRSVPPFWDTFRVLFVKFLVLPVLVIALMYFLQAGQKYPLLAQVLIIQAASAPATAHILMVRTYGGDLRGTGGITFVGYIVCVLAIPLWLTVWSVIS